jgi:hypothetical protein
VGCAKPLNYLRPPSLVIPLDAVFLGCPTGWRYADGVETFNGSIYVMRDDKFAAANGWNPALKRSEAAWPMSHEAWSCCHGRSSIWTRRRFLSGGALSKEAGWLHDVRVLGAEFHPDRVTTEPRPTRV